MRRWLRMRTYARALGLPRVAYACMCKSICVRRWLRMLTCTRALAYADGCVCVLCVRVFVCAGGCVCVHGKEHLYACISKSSCTFRWLLKYLRGYERALVCADGCAVRMHALRKHLRSPIDTVECFYLCLPSLECMQTNFFFSLLVATTRIYRSLSLSIGQSVSTYFS